MKNLRTIILSAMVAGVLIVPGTSARADGKDEKDHHHFRKHDHDGKWKGHATTYHTRTVITSDMIRITDVMFVMTIVAIITSRRFDRISKMFAMHATK